MKPKKQFVFTAILFLVVLCAGTVSVGLYSHYQNTQRVNVQISSFANENTIRTEKHLGDVFADQKSTIASCAYLYGSAMKTADPDLVLLKQLENDSGFDWIRFIDSDGVNFTSSGPLTNVKDRPYFINGMKGLTGLTAVSASRVNGQRLIGCYSPIYFDHDIVGVMVGFLSESTVEQMLSSTVYGYHSVAMIVNRQGEILGDSGYTNFTMDGFVTIIPDAEKQAFVDAYSNQTTLQFQANGTKGKTVGTIRPISHTEWSVCQLFPPEAYKALIDGADRDSILSISAVATLIAVIALFGGFVFWRMLRMSVEVERHEEREALDRVRQHDYDIIQGLARIYKAVYYVDIRLDSFERVFSNVPEISAAIPKKGNATLTFEYFANEFVYPEFTDTILRFTNLHSLSDRLQNVPLISVEFQEINRDSTSPRNWSEASFIPAKRDANGRVTHALFAIADIEERKAKDIEYTNNLKAALAKAEAASVAKSAFLSNMSHDIRTPMNAVLGFTALAQSNINNPEKLAEYLRKIAQSGDALLDLLNNVLELSRIESGRTEVNCKSANMEDLNESIIATFEVEMANKNLHFHYRPSLKNTHFLLDVTKVRQILINVFSNAVKYTPKGGAVSYRVSEVENEGNTELLFVVSDTGVGMSKDFIPRLFDRFEREEKDAVKGIRGTGLGMAIVQKLVALLHGRIEVDSAVGKGTTISITLPTQLPTEAEIADSVAIENPVAQASYPGKRALMAEDNELNAEIAKSMLTSRGLEVEWVKDGLDAFHAIQNHPDDYYDIVFLDIQMPRMDGHACATAIRGLKNPVKRKLPIVAMTANAFDEDVRHSIQAGMNEHLGKPLSPSALDVVLHRFLSGKK